ncbi:MAG: hypothetical protein AAGK97_18340, partial [Bacteroidota bacterium]
VEKHDILNQLSIATEACDKGDYLLFYFAGLVRTESIFDKTRISIDKQSHLCLIAGLSENPRRETIAIDELKYFSKRISAKGGRAIFIIDAVNAISPNRSQFDRAGTDFSFFDAFQNQELGYNEFIDGGHHLIWMSHEITTNSFGKVFDGLFSNLLLEELHNGNDAPLFEINRNIESKLNRPENVVQQKMALPSVKNHFEFNGIDFREEKFLEGVFNNKIIKESQQAILQYFKQNLEANEAY